MLIANRDTIDLDLIRKEWAVLASDRIAQTAWFEAAVARLFPPPAGPASRAP